jgi:inorganic pyrophosphatase
VTVGRHLKEIAVFDEEPVMKSLRNPTKLKPVGKGNLLQVIIETPAGSRNKFSFDAEQGIFAHKKTLPAGMTFPYDFGFLPQTLAPDGDPIDVLLLMDEPAFPGIAVKGRLIGVIEGQQIDGKKKIRNDRLVVVAEENHRYTNVRKLKDLPRQWTEEVEEFFVNYHDMEGKKYQLLGSKGVSEAQRLIRKARRAAQ